MERVNISVICDSEMDITAAIMNSLSNHEDGPFAVAVRAESHPRFMFTLEGENFDEIRHRAIQIEGAMRHLPTKSRGKLVEVNIGTTTDVFSEDDWEMN